LMSCKGLVELIVLVSYSSLAQRMELIILEHWSSSRHSLPSNLYHVRRHGSSKYSPLYSSNSPLIELGYHRDNLPAHQMALPCLVSPEGREVAPRRD
jgi:hypothetical protein